MTDKQPLGPALAQTLGGVWDEHAGRVQLPNHIIISVRVTGAAWLISSGGVERRLGTLSDGVDALAQAARNHGVGT